MPPIRADLNSGNFEVKDAGEYLVNFFSYKRGITQKGDTKVNVRLKRQEDGGSFFDNITIIPSVMWKFKQLAIAAGYDATALEGEHDVGFRDEFAGVPEDELVDPIYVEDVLEEILGADLLVDVSVQPAGDGYEARNQIRRYKSATEALVAAGSGW